jgi:hypothetical protein
MGTMIGCDRNARIRAVLVASVAASLGACSTTATSIERSSTAPLGQRLALHKVATVFVSRDQAARRAAEDRIAEELNGGAVPAYRVLGYDLVEGAHPASALRARGFDGVITMRVLGEQRVRAPGPGHPYYPEIASWSSPYALTREPQPHTVVRVETKAYSLTSDRPVWSGITETRDPSSEARMVEQVAKEAGEKMRTSGILPPAP